MDTGFSPNLTDESRRETTSGVAISLAFWLSLLCAAIFFAAVALSPKFAAYLKLRHQFHQNQVQLVALERQAEKLQMVIKAIHTDKDFSSEMTRVEFDAVRPDEEVIPVDFALKLDSRAIEAPGDSSANEMLWYEPGIQFLATDARVRNSCLGVAAVLIIISFTMFQPAGTEQLSSGVNRCNSILNALLGRYLSSSSRG